MNNFQFAVMAEGGSNDDTKSGADRASPSEMSKISLKLPIFWPNSPTTWFVQAESQFALARITSDVNKYNYIVTSLPQDVAESITDILENPPVINMYATLKKALTERHSLSTELRLKKLLSGEQLGDKKPSDFYRYLKTLAGSSNAVGAELIRNIWQNRLPHLINIAIIPQKDQPLETLLSVADQIWEAMQSSNISSIGSSSESRTKNPTVNSATSHSDDKFNHIEREINELKQMFADMKTNTDRSRSRSRDSNSSRFNRSRSHSRGRRSFNKNGSLCWYHFKFSNKANKCINPCEWKNKTTNTNNNSTN